MVSGAVRSTVQEWFAGVGPNVADRVGGPHLEGMAAGRQACELLDSVQAQKAAPSRLHSKVDASVAVKLKLADVEFVAAAGAGVIVVFGVLSIDRPFAESRILPATS